MTCRPRCGASSAKRMSARLRFFSALSGITAAALCWGGVPAQAQQSTEALAAAAQNPVAAMISLLFQNNTFFDAGAAHDQTANVLNIQPVLPFTIGDWNIISRTIAPLIALPSLTGGALGDAIADAPSSNDPFGLGDINQTFYFSPAAATDFIWGIGPSVTLSTATQRVLGPRTRSMGPGAVVLVMPKPWVIGTLARQLWGVAGPNQDINQMLVQPFVNYMPDGARR